MNTRRNDLTPQEVEVMFEGGTEPPFTGPLLKEDRTGVFVCKNCQQELFSSQTKYDSGSGWPSFTAPVETSRVQMITDVSHGMTRTEVRCGRCRAHLGHVFPDGPLEAGGQRYCINSASLEFAPKENE